VALEKARRIATAHKPVLDALGGFLLKHSNTIVVLLGNHDVELAYNEVWNVVQSAINPKDPSRLILKAVPPNTTFTWARFCCMYSTTTYVI
jgi:hypothetical protein